MIRQIRRSKGVGDVIPLLLFGKIKRKEWTVTGVHLPKQEIERLISNMLMAVIEENEPFQWIKTEEPFYNPYKNKISYDYSGEVRPMAKEEFQGIVANLGGKEWYSSKLEELLSLVYINRWEPTYMSNYGKNWLNYKDLLQRKFSDWKYENFDLYDEDGNELNEELEIEIDEVLYTFLEQISHEMYARKILRKWG